MLKNEMRRSIGERLRTARLKAKLTQDEVAADFKRSRQSISSWESGKTLPDALDLRKIAALYAVSTDRLLFGDDPERRAAVVVAGFRSAPSRDFAGAQ